MTKPLFGSMTILFYADDVPGKMSDEQAEAKEWEFERIRLRIKQLLGHLALEENWEWKFPYTEVEW